MLKKINVSSIVANPFRELDDYPIDREKVDALKESIESTGFWGTIVARKKGSKYELAFGHHRWVALKELKVKQCDVIVRDLSNEDMVQMMARENLEEWGTNAYIEAQTVESTIRAYGRGDIEIVAPDTKTNKSHVRYADAPRGGSEHPYTKQTIASFLGWVGSDGEPNHCCRVAFQTVDSFIEGIVTRKQLRGVSRDVAREICSSAMAIKRQQEAKAREAEKEAKKAETAAEQEEDARKRRSYKSVAKRKEAEAKAAKSSAKTVAKEFAKDAVKQTKSGNWAQRDVRKAAAEEKARLQSKAKKRYKDAQQYYNRLSRDVSKMLNEKTDNEFKSLMSLLTMDCGLDQEDVDALIDEIDALAKRAAQCKKKLRAWKPPVIADTAERQLRIVG